MSSKSSKRPSRSARTRIVPTEDSSDGEEVSKPSQASNRSKRGQSASSGSDSPQDRRRPALSQKKRQEKPRRRVVESNSESESDTKKTKSQSQKSKKNGPVAKKNQTKSKEKAAEADERTRKSEQRVRVKEMVNQGVLYLSMANAKKVPVRRADFTRIVCNGEREVTKKVLSKVQVILENVFGIEIYALNESTLEYETDLLVQGRSCFLLVSQFKPLTLVNNLMEQDEREEALRASLFICLNLIFMQHMETGIPEAQLWTALSRLGFLELLKIFEKDFTRFLKTEYVQTYYLRTEESKDEYSGVTTTRYFWGPRSHLEYSKLAVFMHALKLVHARTSDFPKHIQMILDTDEREEAIPVFEAWEKSFNVVVEAEASGGSSNEDSATDEGSSEDGSNAPEVLRTAGSRGRPAIESEAGSVTEDESSVNEGSLASGSARTMESSGEDNDEFTEQSGLGLTLPSGLQDFLDQDFIVEEPDSEVADGESVVEGSADEESVDEENADGSTSEEEDNRPLHELTWEETVQRFEQGKL